MSVSFDDLLVFQDHWKEQNDATLTIFFVPLLTLTQTWWLYWNLTLIDFYHFQLETISLPFVHLVLTD